MGYKFQFEAPKIRKCKGYSDLQCARLPSKAAGVDRRRSHRGASAAPSPPLTPRRRRMDSGIWAGRKPSGLSVSG